MREDGVGVIRPISSIPLNDFFWDRRVDQGGEKVLIMLFELPTWPAESKKRKENLLE